MNYETPTIHDADPQPYVGKTPSIVVSPFQKSIIDLMLKEENYIAESNKLGKQLGQRPQSIGAALQHLEKKGLVQFITRGVWRINPVEGRMVVVGKDTRKYKPKPKPKEEKVVGTSRTAIGTPAAGDLFELVGATGNGQLLVRGIDNHIVYAISEL
jgi:hypothetical protein